MIFDGDGYDHDDDDYYDDYDQEPYEDAEAQGLRAEVADRTLRPDSAGIAVIVGSGIIVDVIRTEGDRFRPVGIDLSVKVFRMVVSVSAVRIFGTI